MEIIENGISTDYKKSEVGFVPEDWQVLNFNTVFKFLTTASFSRAELDESGEIQCVHYGDIHTKFHHFINFSKVQINGCSSKTAKTYDTLQNGDLIIADASEDYEGIGKGVEVKGLSNCKAISGLHTFLLRDKSNYFVDGFKAYIHCIPKVSESYKKLATGLKVYGISKKQLKSILIPIPTLKEQKAIATALSDVDALIEKLEALIAKKKAIKEGTMQRLLTPPHKGGQRLPGFDGVWEEKRLGEVAWYQEGPGLRNWQFETSGIKVLNITNLVGGYLHLNRTQRYISWEEFNNQYKHFEIDEGDLVVASSGNSYCKSAIVRSQDLPLVLNTSLIRFKTKGIEQKLLHIFLKSNLFKDQIDLLITGGAQPNFGPAHLKKIILHIPTSIEEQKAISKVLSEMDLEIETIQSKKAKYKKIKEGMMQELLTGKTRLV